MSFRAKVPWHKIAGATLVTEVRDMLVKALLEEARGPNKIRQADVARTLGVDRSVVHRQLVGTGDLGLSRIGEIAAILGRDAKFVLSEKKANQHENTLPVGQLFPVERGIDLHKNITPSNSSAHSAKQYAPTIEVRPHLKAAQ